MEVGLYCAVIYQDGKYTVAECEPDYDMRLIEHQFDTGAMAERICEIAAGVLENPEAPTEEHEALFRHVLTLAYLRNWRPSRNHNGVVFVCEDGCVVPMHMTFNEGEIAFNEHDHTFIRKELIWHIEQDPSDVHPSDIPPKLRVVGPAVHAACAGAR